MSCRPLDFLRLAESLADNDACSEIECRCSISRAYYAALHAVDEAFSENAGAGRIEGESSHAEIIRRARDFGRTRLPGRTNASIIAQLMGQLKADRNNADYQLLDSVSKRKMLDVIERVKKVLEECEDFSLKNPSGK